MRDPLYFALSLVSDCRSLQCSRQRHDLIFGGVNESGAPNLNLYGYNMSSNGLAILSDFNHTKTFPTAGLSCTVNQGAIYYYANESLFSYDITFRNWTLHNVAFNPGNREGSSLISYENSLVLFGGTTDEQIWIFSLDVSNWTNKTVPEPRPGPRSNHLAVYDYTRIGKPQMILYGGNLEKDVTFHDLWSYNFKNNSWKQFFPKATPGSREKTNYISSYGRIILYGGEHNATASFSDLWVLVIETDCYSYGWDCFHCAQSVGCGWCNSNPLGYQCVAGHDYAYINYTCNNTSNNFLNNFTKDYLMCPIVGFPGWIVALLTLTVPILIGLVIWLYHYFTHRSKMPSSDFVAINVDEGTPIIRHDM